MKNKKEKRKILRVRPFNMANFSGGSGYLVFSVVYQAMAIIPAMFIIWLASLIKLPKQENSDAVDSAKAGRRFYIVSIPMCIILIAIGLVLAIVTNYGTFLEYGIEILFIGFVPSICLFFIMRYCHKQIVENGKSVIAMVLLSFGLTIVVLLAVFLFSWFILDRILSEVSYGY